LLRTLIDGPRRFNEIADRFASTDGDELSVGLRDLDSGGLVARRVDPGPPLRVLYELTPLGAELAPALCVLGEWAGRSA
jgi:DNA-binding HxlR family transcriptional regulator